MVLNLNKEIMGGYFYLWCLVVKPGEFKFANGAMVLLVMEMLRVLNMAMLIIRVHNIMDVLNGIKPQEYTQKKKGADFTYGSFCHHEWLQR